MHARVEKEEGDETMTTKDAAMFPVYGSCVLFSIYIAYKFLPKEWLNIIFTCHFTFIGIFCLAAFMELPVSKFVPASWKNLIVIDRIFHINLGFVKKDFPIKLNYLEAVCVSLAIGPAVIYAGTKHWISNNIFGIAFSVVGIENLNLPNFKTGFILLWGLFFYDIFWVFGTDVMVTVAKSFDAPIKVVFPKDIFEVVQAGLFSRKEKLPFSLLGLGDIVIPGIFVALCLQFDLHMHKRRLNGKSHATSGAARFNFPKPYFIACFTAYFGGLFTTMFVMHYFKAAQPALLYLSPACTILPLIVALARGEVKDMFAFAPQVESDAMEGKDVADAGKEEVLDSPSPKKRSRKKKIS